MAAVWGEYLFGIGKGADNLIYMTFSTGIGAGIIVDGHLLVGKDGNAHEIGHLVIDINSGIQCGCGGYGHWEALARAPTYLGSLRNSLKENPISQGYTINSLKMVT